MRVHIHISYEVELPRICTPMAELAHNGTIAAVQDPDHAIRPISDQQILLFRIMRKCQGPSCSPAYRLGRDEDFLHEFALLGEYLHSVGRAICHIHQVINGDLNGVEQPSKLLGRRGRGVIARLFGVVNLAERDSLGAPPSLERASV
jgi:hypothetical protein